jgi:tetratricopeptide (TPR) repeat protein
MPIFCLAQSKKVDTIRGKEANEMASQIFKKSGFDSSYILRNASKNACTCIDSVYQAVVNSEEKIKGIADCIDKEVQAYQLSLALLKSMNDNSSKNQTINIYSKNSDEYKRGYFQIERWLSDSCAIMATAMRTNNEEGELSMSKNEAALNPYYKGVEFLKKQQYAEALPYFKKATEIDAKFGFAWDNLGVCYRRTEKYDEAVVAYKKSLAIDPKGKTALQNLPVVYMLQKKDDEAINAYKNILKYYSNDPEVYFGIGLVYYQNKNDMENALDNMCKAYKLYVQQKSPYRSDAEKVINMIYSEMKKTGKLDQFNAILKRNDLNPN